MKVVRLALSYSSGVSSDFSSSPRAFQLASLKRPLTGSGNIDRATGPKPAKRASPCFSSAVAARCSCSMALSVRMAARMSRAFVFSPLAMGTPGDGCSEGVACASGKSTASVGRAAGVAEAGVCWGGGGSGSAVAGLEGKESNRVGWRRDALTRAACDGGETAWPRRGTVPRSRSAETRRANDPPFP